MEFIIESDRHDTEHIDTINPYIKPEQKRLFLRKGITHKKASKRQQM